MMQQRHGNTYNAQYVDSMAATAIESADIRMNSIVNQLEAALSKFDELDPPMSTPPDVGRAPRQVGLLAGLETANDLVQTVNLRLNGLLARIGRL